MAHLIKIGNSQGIRIPQSMIKKAHKKTIKDWKERFKSIAASQIEQDFNETNSNLAHSSELATGETWEW
ncbi:MAG: AbrB/MazE/SpoVT family DNA-binding domain-containing protein [Methylococcales bacterium]|nr:AbrB/MazE/SpoVT family DNA-binding domain-containing protein [Methylococcales bacterium]MDD5632082.1 AbrB/MazE/SpoVT family DNA-binding domain-containing protein [Methylococcales bacterium]